MELMLQLSRLAWVMGVWFSPYLLINNSSEIHNNRQKENNMAVLPLWPTWVKHYIKKKLFGFMEHEDITISVCDIALSSEQSARLYWFLGFKYKISNSKSLNSWQAWVTHQMSNTMCVTRKCQPKTSPDSVKLTLTCFLRNYRCVYDMVLLL